MSKPLMSQSKEKWLQGLLVTLKGAENQPSGDSAAVLKSSIREVVGLMELLLSQKPIVLDKDLSPNEAAEITGVSRSLVMKMLKNGRLKGYEVGAHWRISKESVLKYLEDREEMMEMMSKMDEAGFGMD